MQKIKKISELKVLVVDDIASFREDIVQILNKLGVMNIHEAADGLLAWDKAIIESKGREGFDLVISDINMPKMTGIELLKQMRNFTRTAKIPFILVSTESEKDIIIRALLLDISEYLIKPYDKELAISKIRTVLLKITQE